MMPDGDLTVSLSADNLVFAPDDVELFLHHEARLLDERRFTEWMDLFTEDAIYWVPAVPGQESPLNHVSLFFDDRNHMQTRVTRLGHPMIHVQDPPSRTLHQLGRVMIEKGTEGADELVVTSTVLMVEYRLDNQRVFPGRQVHRLRREGGGLRIALKRVDLINCDTAFGAIAVPI